MVIREKNRITIKSAPDSTLLYGKFLSLGENLSHSEARLFIPLKAPSLKPQTMRVTRGNPVCATPASS